MKKIFLILSILFMLCGCSASYEININKDYIYDNIDITSIDSEDSNNIFNYKEPLPAFIDNILPENPEEKYDDVEYYAENKTLDENGYYHLNYKYTFKKEDYLNNNVINSSVVSYYYTLKDNETSVSVSNFVKVFNAYEELDNLNIKVNISDDYEIINSNAETKEGNTLYWHVNRENYRISSMFLRLKEKDNHEDNVDNSNLNNNNNDDKNDKKEKSSIILVSISLLVFLGVLIVIISLKNKIDKY